MKRGYKIVTYVVITLIATLTLTTRATAQHTLTLTGGTGVATARFYPDEETKWMWGSETFGLSWRFYSEKPRFVGAVGVDLEYMERGFNFGYAYSSEFIEQEDGQKKEKRTYYFYNRKINTLMLPLVWQPHFYLAPLPPR